MSIKNKAIRAFKWSFLGNLMIYSVGFIFSIILARILSPEEFGLLAMAMVIISISQGLLDLGFSSAIIQQKEVNQKQLSTIFFINCVLSFLCTFIVYCSAGWIADFYKSKTIRPIIEVISLVFIFRGIGLVQMSLFTKELKYDVLTKISGLSVLISGTLALCFSFFNFGVWALVTQQLSLALISTILYWVYSSWKPSLIFSMSSVKDMFSYGSKLFVSSLFSSIYNKLDTIVIGRIMTPHTLGLYNRSLHFQSMFKMLSTSGFNVLFPAISKKQNDRKYLSGLIFDLFSIVSLVSVFMSFWLFVIAKSLFVTIIGTEWIVAAEYFKILMITGFIFPVSLIGMHLIKAMGNSSIYLKLELVKKVLLMPSFLILFFFGIKWFLYTKIVLSLICLVINYKYVTDILNSNLLKYISELLEIFLMVLLPVSASWLLGQYIPSDWMSIILCTLIYCLLTFVVIYYFKRTKILDFYNFYLK